MEKLKQARLYRNELIPINGKLVERYNQCLTAMGLPKTGLLNFSIDGIGWSPEIATELINVHYLNNGDANPNGIIITPLQKGKPTYAPFHSFDIDLMALIFKTYPDEINDITRDGAICIDIDQHIDTFYEPLDLLKYTKVTIGFKLINLLDKEQEKQLQLIETFKRGTNFIDESLQKQLLDSAQKFGDLRERRLTMAPLSYTVQSFYCAAFTGVFVLRDFITPIVVFEDMEWYQKAVKNNISNVLIFHIHQPELLEKLQDHLIIECDLETVVKTLRYERIKKFLFAKTLTEVQHPYSIILDDPTLFKGYLNKMPLADRKKIMGIELYLEKSEIDNQYKLKDNVDAGFYNALHQPHSSLGLDHQDLIWKLLNKIANLDVLFCYWYNNEEFLKEFETFDPSLQDWIIKTIKSNF